MTNLEWIRTLSEEEFADWLYDEWLHHLQYRWSSSRGGLIIWLTDRKTENSSEKPNNCKYAENPSGDVWECGCFLDTYCEHQIYDRNPDGTINIVKCGYEPKTEPFDKDINVRSKDEPQERSE